MEINSITSISNAPNLIEEFGQLTVKSDSSFESYLANELSNVNNNIIKAEATVSDFAAGKTSNIHEVLLSIEEAKLSFQMMLQVRNKVLESVQEILRMQV